MKAKIKIFWRDFFHYLKTKDYQWKFKLIVILPLFFALLVIDVLSKTLIHKNLQLGQEINFMPGFINIQLVYNKGSAFGYNSENPTFVITSAIILAFVILLAVIFLTQKPLLIGLTMMFTGAIGNLIDRCWNSSGVVDFFAWQLFQPYSIFNFADICVVFGLVEVVCTIVYSFMKDFILDRKELKQAEKIKDQNIIEKDKESDKQDETN